MVQLIFYTYFLVLLLLSSFSRVRLYATPEMAGHQATRPWDSPGKNTGVGCHVILQGIFPTQGLNPCVSYISCIGRQVLYY